MSKKRYYEKNKQFAVWLPQTLYLWFSDYLQKYSYGDSLAQQFKIFLLKLQEQEEQGITIANAKKDFEQQATLKRDLQQKPIEEICVKGLDLIGLPAQKRKRLCEICKIVTRQAYVACREVRRESKEAHRL